MNRVQVALFLSIPIWTLLAPIVKEQIVALVTTPVSISAFEGDGILVADTGSYGFSFFSFLPISWTLTQRPEYGDAYHTISFFVVPEKIAHRFLYLYNSTYKSDSFFVDGGIESERYGLEHLNLMSNIYLLPKKYTPGKEAKAEFKVQSTRILSEGSEVKSSSPVCRFQNPYAYSDFLDMENYSIDNTFTICRPQYSFGYGNFEFNENNTAEFTTEDDSYNFFSAVVPTKSYVQFKTDIHMYFYNQTKLAKYFQCRIRGVDTCSFTTVQRHWARNLVIAYTHPTTVASPLTTTISIKADILVWQAAAYFLVCLLTPCLLIRTIFL